MRPDIMSVLCKIYRALLPLSLSRAQFLRIIDMESRMTRLQLWAVHPDIVSVLCKICPALLEDLLDGDADPHRINHRDSLIFRNQGHC